MSRDDCLGAQLRDATGPTCNLTQFATAKIRSALPSLDERPQMAHIGVIWAAGRVSISRRTRGAKVAKCNLYRRIRLACVRATGIRPPVCHRWLEQTQRELAARRSDELLAKNRLQRLAKLLIRNGGKLAKFTTNSPETLDCRKSLTHNHSH